MGYAKLDLNGKSAVVIGGTSGIGRAIALGLAEAGADVAATSRRADQVEATAGEIEALGRRSLRAASDVADRASLHQLLDAAIQTFGKVDILVNSAGRTKKAPTLDFSEQDWNAIFETNLTGMVRACQIFGRHMLERRYGRIINVASIGSFRGMMEVSAYSASKTDRGDINDFAVAAFQHVPAENLARSHHASEIRFENVVPVLFGKIEGGGLLCASG